jgi:Saccharopine dehydrogenase NADP binding domain
VSGAAPIGVIGAYGGVGRAAVRRLAAAGAGPLRVGGRRLDLARHLAAEQPGGDAQPAWVDAGCADSLERFCAGCRLVVNCAGPSHELVDTVARAAWSAGADVVETGGDDPVHERLSGLDAAGRTAVVSAGMMPGLSGLLPRCLASGFDRPVRLTAYAGGRGRLTPAAASDYLAALGDGAGEPLAAWRRGRRVARALAPLRDVALPLFPERVTGHPFLSTELERVARALGLDEVDWYNVVDGTHLPAALARLQGVAREGVTPEAAQEVVRASELDRFGRSPYQLMVMEMAGEAGGVPVCRTLFLRARDGIELSGAVTALAALAVLRGQVPPGVHRAAETLTPPAWWDRLRSLPEVQALQVMEGTAAGMAVEEGEL